MAENNSPRKTRSGKLLGGAIPGGEAEGQEEAGMEMPAVEGIIREETDVDVIDLTEDYFDVDELLRDDNDAGDLGDVTEATSNEDMGNGTITIVDDDAFTGRNSVMFLPGANNDSCSSHSGIDDIPTGANELNEGCNQGGVLDLTVDLTDSPLTRSNLTVFKLPNFSVSATFTSASTSGASLPSTSGASLSSTSASTSAASMPSTSPSTSGDSLPSTAPSNASAAVTCRICLDSQLDLEKEGGNLLSTVCGHIFCFKCLPNYIKKRGLCPICRKVLKPKDFHQIFL